MHILAHCAHSAVVCDPPSCTGHQTRAQVSRQHHPSDQYPCLPDAIGNVEFLPRRVTRWYSRLEYHQIMPRHPRASQWPRCHLHNSLCCSCLAIAKDKSNRKVALPLRVARASKVGKGLVLLRHLHNGMNNCNHLQQTTWYCGHPP